MQDLIAKLQHMKKLNKLGINRLIPDKLSIILSLIFSILFALCFSLTTYLPAALDKQISSSNFTVSQSLAFAVKGAFLGLFSVILILGIFIIWYCGYNFVWIRIFILISIFALIITLLWVTTYYNKTDHYILAGIIFTLSSLFICLTSFVIIQARGYKNLSKYTKIICIVLPALSILGLLGLFISLKYLENIKELFPSFELFASSIFVMSFVSIGII